MNAKSDDPIVTLAGVDAEMQAAIQRAQETFPTFVHELELDMRRAVPAVETALLKVFFCDPETPGRGEHMFVDQVWLEGDRGHGILASTPQNVTGLGEGQNVTFPISQISDWFIVIDGRGQGGHTLDVIARQMGAAAYRQVANQPPFAWFSWRADPWEGVDEDEQADDAEEGDDADGEPVKIEDADLRRAEFINTSLSEAQFRNVSLEGAQFVDVNLAGVSFEDVNFTGTVIHNANCTDVSFEDANYDGMRIDGILVTDLLRVYRSTRK